MLIFIFWPLAGSAIVLQHSVDFNFKNKTPGLVKTSSQDVSCVQNKPRTLEIEYESKNRHPVRPVIESGDANDTEIVMCASLQSIFVYQIAQIKCFTLFPSLQLSRTLRNWVKTVFSSPLVTKYGDTNDTKVAGLLLFI